jgi:hypothetical protein
MKQRLHVDFARTPTPGFAGVALLAIGAAALASAVVFHQRVEGQRAAVEDERRAQAERAQREARLAAQPRPPSPDELRFRAVAPQLAQPWLPTLRWIETLSKPPVHLTALEIDPSQGSLRIDGEAPTFGAAVDYANELNRSDLLDQAQLRLHEMAKDADASPVAVRFSASARWVRR